MADALLPEPQPLTVDAWVELAARAIAEARDDDVFTAAHCVGTHWGGGREMYRYDAEAVLAALAAVGALVTPPGQRATTDPVEPCDYVSKACQHGLHKRCRLSCKFCAARCGCPRHGDDTASCGPAAEVPRG
jgi:hypothetical protein